MLSLNKTRAKCIGSKSLGSSISSRRFLLNLFFFLVGWGCSSAFSQAWGSVDVSQLDLKSPHRPTVEVLPHAGALSFDQIRVGQQHKW